MVNRYLVRPLRAFAASVAGLLLCTIVCAQETLKLEDRSLPVINLMAPLAAVEKQLMPVAEYVLRGREFDRKLDANELLKKTLMAQLKKSESYDYKFDSLKTISRIYPADNSFRIFTWVLRDPSGNSTYHGLVQRRVVRPDKTTEIVVIPLDDRVDMMQDIETARLSNDQWMGALYYKPRNTDFGVLTYTGASYRVDGFSGNTKMEKANYYVVLGLNEHNRESNYKIIDVISFDPRYPNKVFFGAPIFYFSPVPRSRVVFKYADNATFTLNYMPVMEGKKQTNMIVFDHIGEAKLQRPQSLYDYGADGSTDGLKFFDKRMETRRGFLGLKKNVTVYEKGTAEFDDKLREKQRQREAERERAMGVGLDGVPRTTRNRK
jgi:hypothetical protein